jgi:ABC-type glycerol-3-phosphate transport system substrate-binding protein
MTVITIKGGKKMKHQKAITISLAFLLVLSLFPLTFVGAEEIATEGLPYPLPQYPIRQEKEAILAAREIAKEMGGKVTLRLLISPDNVPDFEPFYPEWEKETGIKLETHTVPWPDWFKELMDVSITKTDKYDVFMLCPQWIPDLAEARVIENLNSHVNKYKPQITDPSSPHSILPGLESYMKYQNDYYFLFSDTDVATLYLRKDWLEDSDNKKKFESKYGYPLDKPKGAWMRPHLTSIPDSYPKK